jgi:hypothetical protein
MVATPARLHYSHDGDRTPVIRLAPPRRTRGDATAST